MKVNRKKNLQNIVKGQLNITSLRNKFDLLVHLFIELNFHKRKWQLTCPYNPNKNNIMNHLGALQRNLELYSSEYEHVILLGGFNVETKEPCM